MTFELTILGCSSATPAFQRNPSSQVLNIHDKLFMIDCGEATQIQLSRFKVKLHRINHIFISHLHGDHYLGLMGFLSTLHLQGRSAVVHIYCHKELKEIIDLELKVSDTSLRFPLEFHFLTNEEKILYEDDDIQVESILLNHRIPCIGFLFREKVQARSLNKEKLQHFKLPHDAYDELKNGNDTKDIHGAVVLNSEVTFPSKPARSYAYCSDTVYDETVIAKVNRVNLLYHEATFLHEMLDRALETFHTTSLQAGQAALKANVGQLIIGHFSARYKELEPLLNEAKSAFPNTLLAIEGERYNID